MKDPLFKTKDIVRLNDHASPRWKREFPATALILEVKKQTLANLPYPSTKPRGYVCKLLIGDKIVVYHEGWLEGTKDNGQG